MIAVFEILFDILLAIVILWLAIRTVYIDNMFESIMSFIGFGLFMSMAWLRLGSIDLALAEAALGSGISGALLLMAKKKLSGSVVVNNNHTESSDE